MATFLFSRHNPLSASAFLPVSPIRPNPPALLLLPCRFIPPCLRASARYGGNFFSAEVVPRGLSAGPSRHRRGKPHRASSRRNPERAARARSQHAERAGGAAAGAGEEHARKEGVSGDHLAGRTVLVTAPAPYDAALSAAVRAAGGEAVACSMVATDVGDEACRRAVERFLDVAAIAFTSRNGITAFANAVQRLPQHALPAAWRATVAPSQPQQPLQQQQRLQQSEEEQRQQDEQEHQQQSTTPLSTAPCSPLLIGALGRDAELLSSLGPIVSHPSTRLVLPPVATPLALADALGPGDGRIVACPVPRVEGLEEPPVVPTFLRALEQRGWRVLRIDCYVTRWTGTRALMPVLAGAINSQGGGDTSGDGEGGELGELRAAEGAVNMHPSVAAVVFSSTAEAQGFVACCHAMGVHPLRFLGRHESQPPHSPPGVDAADGSGVSRRGVVVAAHGPVTAEGMRNAGLPVDVVSQQFSSFAGVVDALAAHLAHLD
ncbi:unnamed protein product [Closterium sp. Naga37s-1]|nr:unnamed protein product [Closterium sp. Naga37s-1]